MHLRVNKSPVDLPEDFPLDESTVNAVRFADERGREVIDLLRDTCWELAQYQERCEELEKRLAKHEKVEPFITTPYTHINVER